MKENSKLKRTPKKMAVSRQTGSKQDYAVSGTLTNGHFIAVFDGHGTNACIDRLRTLNMREIMESENPMLTLWDAVQGNTFRSGATASLARITDRVEIWSMGDSEMHVFVNETLVYSTEVHTFTNPNEIERLRSKVTIRNEKAPFPVSSTRIEMVNSPYGDFPCGESLIPSQSLGHNGITGFAPCMSVIEFKEADSVRVVGGSDGLFDMLVDVSTGSAEDLVSEAERRWRMKWEYFDGQRVHVTGYDSIDDISCVLFEKWPTLCIPYAPTFTVSDVHEIFDSFGTCEVSQEETAFFIRCVNPLETMRAIYAKLKAGKPVKIWVRENWYWNVCLSNR